MLKKIYHFSIYKNMCKSVQNLSEQQLTNFDEMVRDRSIDDIKQVNLLAYLVQKLKPSLIPYKQLLAGMICERNIKSNQELDKAIKELKQNSCMGIFKCQSDDKGTRHKIAYFEGRDIEIAQNRQEHLQQHYQQTQGKIVLRFPPEPNGYLHLGHVRSIRLNFHSAQQLQGICYLRYDDTNPDTEKQQYIDQIRENVQWFGYDVQHVTYASNYFDAIHDCAIKLIEKGLAYVCEQTKEQMYEERRNKQPSPYRNRSMNQNLKLFKQMQEDDIPEYKYTLRLKIDYQHDNPTLRDPVIYRIKHQSHPRSGNKWKIYPTYDFAHCICDSIENITHSLCTLEFEIRRELYYWILDNLDLYKPTVYEFSRLNVSNNMLSKRKIAKLVEQGKVDGWDDPRLLTLNGLQKRGYTATAINMFIDQVSTPRSGNEHIISIKLLESCMRKELDHAQKLMVVIDPVIGIIQTNNEQYQIYIDRKDIRLQDKDDYFGIAPSKIICLKYYGLVRCTNIQQNENDFITCVNFQLLSTNLEDRKQVKGQLHWIGNDNIDAQIKEYSELFNIENPLELENFMDSFNADSLKVYIGKVPKREYKKGERYQFERCGYYIVDSVTPLVFIKIVGLVESTKKKLL
ncbi:hypothetical protein pb186bvf_020033 [Paramecium bursaria]